MARSTRLSLPTTRSSRSTSYENLIPVSVAKEIIGRMVESESALMRLARVVQMPTGIEKIPSSRRRRRRASLIRPTAV